MLDGACTLSTLALRCYRFEAEDKRGTTPLAVCGLNDVRPTRTCSSFFFFGFIASTQLVCGAPAGRFPQFLAHDASINMYTDLFWEAVPSAIDVRSFRFPPLLLTGRAVALPLCGFYSLLRK